MHEVLNKNFFLVKEHVGMFKAANNYDIYDPESGQIIMDCREERLGLLTKIFRFTDWKRMIIVGLISQPLRNKEMPFDLQKDREQPLIPDTPSSYLLFDHPLPEFLKI